MRLAKYGVSLNKLTEDKLEMIRDWRNDPKISQYMDYKEYITPEMQLNWFRKIDNENNYYFIIEYKKAEIGLINIKDIDYKLKLGEAGIYIYSDEWLNSTVSFQASLCLYDFCFETLGLELIVAHILKDNKRAIRFNKIFGYELLENQEYVINQLYTLSASTYFYSRNEISVFLNI